MAPRGTVVEQIGGGLGAAFTPTARHPRHDGADGSNPTRIAATKRDGAQKAIGPGWDRRPRFEPPSAWDHANGLANGRPAKPAEPGASTEGHALAGAPARDFSGLLIRGFGVQVPGGAPVSDSAPRRAGFARVAAPASLASSKSGSTAPAASVIGHLPDSIFCESAVAVRLCVGVTDSAHELVA